MHREQNDKKYIVFINAVSKRTEGLLKKYIAHHDKPWDYRILKQVGETPMEKAWYIDYENKESIVDFFETFGADIICITTRAEKDLPLFQKIIPYTPKHILVPTVLSLDLCLEKTKMRKALYTHDAALTPKFFTLDRYNPETIDALCNHIEFPVIVKPSGLNSSLLIQAAYYPEELKTILENIFHKIQDVYTQKHGRGAPEVLVEELIEGSVYSVDAHINNRGEVFFNPFIKYKVATEKGFDDFFIYEVSAPADLPPPLIDQAQKVSQKGITALGLKNSSAHIELIYKHDTWKLIEIGARVGGNRSTLYKKTFNTNIDINDILIRMDKKIEIQDTHVGYSSILKLYPKKEGYITHIQGLSHIQTLPSVSKIIPNLNIGAYALFAKNGGEPILKVNLFHTDRLQLLADKRKVEKILDIKTTKKSKGTDITKRTS